MAVDEALALHARRPTLRFYGWSPPAVSLGHFQGRKGEDLGPLLRSGLDVVRRETGGGAIVHWHELTYSLLLPEDAGVLAGGSVPHSYAILHGPIRLALEELGLEVAAREAPRAPVEPLLCFHRITGLDLLLGTRKLVGSAQRRRGGRLLQHGSIVLRRNPWQPGTAAIEDALGERTPSAEELAARLRPRFEALLGRGETGELDAQEERHAQDAAPRFLVQAARAGEGEAEPASPGRGD